MLDIFRSLFTFWRRRTVYTDTLMFRVHTRLTVALLLLFSVIVIARQYIWDPIVCYGQDLPKDILNAYCWTHSTFTVSETGTRSPFDEIAPGVVKSDKAPIREHRYYQWVGLCLFFQAVLFYTPKWLWSVWEEGKIHRLKMNLSSGFLPEEERLKRRERALQYLISNLNTHEFWLIKYFICEVLTLVNVVGQGLLMNRFFGGVFWKYGPGVLDFMKMDSEDRVDPITRIFPEVVTCTLYRYGVSGTIHRYDAMCVIPTNILNQKIYLFVWFWSVLLLVMTSLVLKFRLFTYLNVQLRVYLMRMSTENICVNVLDSVLRRIRSGDWLLLYLLNKNVDPDVFRDLMHEFSKRIGHSEPQELTDFGQNDANTSSSERITSRPSDL